MHALPGTGALRTLFLLFLVGAWLVNVRQQLDSPTVPWWKAPYDQAVLSFALLTAWLACATTWHMVNQGSGAGSEFIDNWGKVILVSLLGASLARRAVLTGERDQIIPLIFCGFFLHAIQTIAYVLYIRLSEGAWRFHDSALGNYGYVSPLVDAALAILLVDLIGRLRNGQRLLPLPAMGWGLAVCVTLTAMLLLKAKASIVVAFALLLATASCLLAKRSSLRRKLAMLLILLASIPILLYGTYDRWQNLTPSVVAGLDINGNRAWLDSRQPLGEGIDESFYLRVAWAKVGIDGIQTHPFGIGYGYEGFGQYVHEHYGVKQFVSSHSGWIDFALANGLPGLILLIMLFASLIWKGWRAYFLSGDSATLLLSSLTLVYALRTLIDGHVTASRVINFALVAGFFWGVTQYASAASVREK